MDLRCKLYQSMTLNKDKQEQVFEENRKAQRAGESYRLGIMGGTFDPVHYGHLAVAETVYWKMDLGSVMFVPSRQPPHKKERWISPVEHRYQMTLLATASNPHFWVSRQEIERSGYSYAIDTVREVKRIFGPHLEAYFIVGTDALLDLLSWKDIVELIDLCFFIVASRPGYDFIEARPNHLFSDRGEKIKTVEVPSLAISSTDIRERVIRGKPIRYLLPEAVEQYIWSSQLYSAV